ncbi:MAG: transrane transporter [Marmoricola sp.]|nr:transrane transporter [Marmoricola sp.]
MTTALATAPTVSLRPVPWTRLAWVTWRRYRFTLLVTVAVVAAISVDLIINGIHMRTAYSALVSCHPAAAASCRFAASGFNDKYGSIGFLSPIILLLPGALGAFAGAPLLARELETGTFRYAWTQGVGRMRWAAALIVPGAVGISMVLWVFGQVVTWHQHPLIEGGLRTRLDSEMFPVTGLAGAGWALLGFALAVFAGLLWRRVLPAVASAFAVWFGLAYLAHGLRRSSYRSPLTTTSLNMANHREFISQFWTRGGVRVSDSEIDRKLSALGADVSGSGVKIHASPGQTDPIQYLIQHGYQQVTSYQPDSRYWPFQWIEFGWLAALSVVLLGVTFWLLRRRAA